MNFEISHRTSFSYSQPVAISHHLLHLVPRTFARQICHRHSLIIEPSPSVLRTGTDYFGNATAYLMIEDPHRALSIVARSSVGIAPPPVLDPSATTPWDRVPGLLAAATDRAMLDAYQFVFNSPFTRSGPDVLAYARESFFSGRPVLEAAIDLMHRVHADFRYEGGVTEIYTPVDSVLAERRGVCQDFAHLFISALRQLGVPARYVSGYLMTNPPPGQPKLAGADASHAWLAVWTPEFGWVDLDPTNDLMPSDGHITVAWGRDYGDVSPINGMVQGGGAHALNVSVDVAPAAA